MTDTATKRKLELRAALASAEALVLQLRTTLESLNDADESDCWLGLDSPKVEATIGSNTARSWIKSGRLQSCTAERGRYIFRQSWLDAAIEAAPVQPRPRKAAPASDLDAWEREAEQQLRALPGGRK